MYFNGTLYVNFAIDSKPRVVSITISIHDNIGIIGYAV